MPLFYSDNDLSLELLTDFGVSKLVGQNPFHASLGGCSGQFLCFISRADGQSADQRILALEGFDDGAVLRVVDLFDSVHACRDDVGAPLTGEGGDFVFSLCN